MMIKKTPMPILLKDLLQKPLSQMALLMINEPDLTWDEIYVFQYFVNQSQDYKWIVNRNL